MATEKYWRALTSAQLLELQSSFPSGRPDERLLVDIVAAMLKADELRGLAREGDRIVLHPSFEPALWIGRPVRTKELVALHQQVSKPHDLDIHELLDLEKKYRQRLVQWFDLRFSPQGRARVAPHPILQGRTLKARLMSNVEAEYNGFHHATARADGTFIVN